MENYDFPQVGEFVNIGTGEDLSIKQLTMMVKEIVGFRGDILWDTTKPDGTPRKLLDVTRIKALGWQPEISLAEGISALYRTWERGMR